MKCRACDGLGFINHYYKGRYDGQSECRNCNGTGTVSGWDDPIYGSVDGEHDVTVVTGLRDNYGQTLIADGHLSKSNFHAHHNHYGPNDKSRYPDQPDRIEDSDRHKDDNAYTGPGC